MHSSAAAHIEGEREGEEIRKNERSIDIYFGKAVAGKKAAATSACAVIQCVRKREKRTNGFIAKMALLTAANRQRGRHYAWATIAG